MENIKIQPKFSYYFIVFYDFLFIFYGAGCFIIAFLAPLLHTMGYIDLSFLFRDILAPTCHQIEERCFFFCSSPVALCVRCTGIYTGILLTRSFLRLNPAGFITIENSFLRRLSSYPIIFLLLCQMFLAWFLINSGIIYDFTFIRFLSGILFGAGWILGPHIYICRGLAYFIEKIE